MILCNNHCYYSLVTSLDCLFHKQVRYIEQQNVTSRENVSMLSAGLKIFVLEEKLNSREIRERFYSSGKPYLKWAAVKKKKVNENAYDISWLKKFLAVSGYFTVLRRCLRRLALSLVLIYRRCTCDVAAGTAWTTSRTNENMRRRQLEPSQSFTAAMPAKLNSTQLRRNVGGKYWDD